MSLAISPGPGLGVQVFFWSPTIAGEIDQFEARDASGIPIARGVRDTTLPEPTAGP